MKITDPDTIEACDFICGYYDDLGRLAPAKFSREEQHAIQVLAAYIKSRRVAVTDGVLGRQEPAPTKPLG
jgi:hypothetical protein